MHFRRSNRRPTTRSGNEGEPIWPLRAVRLAFEAYSEFAQAYVQLVELEVTSYGQPRNQQRGK
ncbi:hypothetical protein GCM10027090_29030 [Sinomonas soli]